MKPLLMTQEGIHLLSRKEHYFKSYRDLLMAAVRLSIVQQVNNSYHETWWCTPIIPGDKGTTEQDCLKQNKKLSFLHLLVLFTLL